MRVIHAILLACGFAILGYLIWSVGTGELWHQVVSLGWGLIPLILGEGIAEMIHTVGWRYCLSGSTRSIPWFTLFRIRMAGYAVNYLTPTAAMGGELTKASLLAGHGSRAEAASGVLVGKLCFALAHMAFVVLGVFLVLWRVSLPGALWVTMFSCGLLMAAGMGAFLLLQKHGKLGTIVRRLAAGKPFEHPLQKAAREVTAIDHAMMAVYRDRPMDLLRAVLWHLVGYSVGIAQTWLFFQLLHRGTSWTVAAAAWFLGMWFDLLTFAVPLNLGTLEGTRILAFRAIGYSSVMGMTYGIALRLAQMAWAGYGLLNHAWLVAKPATPTPGQSLPGASGQEVQQGALGFPGDRDLTARPGLESEKPGRRGLSKHPPGSVSDRLSLPGQTYEGPPAT